MGLALVHSNLHEVSQRAEEGARMDSVSGAALFALWFLTMLFPVWLFVGSSTVGLLAPLWVGAGVYCVLREALIVVKRWPAVSQTDRNVLMLWVALTLAEAVSGHDLPRMTVLFPGMACLLHSLCQGGRDYVGAHARRIRL